MVFSLSAVRPKLSGGEVGSPFAQAKGLAV